MMGELRRLLMNKMELNPFNDKFDKTKFLELITKKIDPQKIAADSAAESLKLLPFFNDHFKEFYSLLKEQFLKANISYKQLVELMFVVLNRNFLVITGEVREAQKRSRIIDQRRTLSFKVNTVDKSIGKIEASAALESDIDSLNIVINYLRYFESDSMLIFADQTKTNPIQIALNIAHLSNYFQILKSSYDDSVWNMGGWDWNNSEKNPVIKLDFADTNLLVINKVGHFRLQRNISSNFIIAFRQLSNDGPVGEIIREEFGKNYKERRLKEVYISNGFINFQLAKGFGKREYFNELYNSSALLTYYPFIDKLEFEKFNNLLLTDLIKLFSLLQELIREASHLQFDDGIESVNDIYKFPLKIDAGKLKEYFIDRTTYTPKQITSFLDLVSFKFGDRINLWDRPLVKYYGAYYFSFIAILSPIILNLMDYWIEQGGFDLDFRGALLEKFIRIDLSNIFIHKKYFHKILPFGKVYNKQKQFEELDLVVILKSIILIAEVKCIKYPLEARDKHNSLNTIRKAAKQIQRKLNFLLINNENLSDIGGYIKGRKLVPIVLTNFPTFSGYTVEGTPVLDFNLLANYFEMGRMNDIKTDFQGNEEIVNEKIYYKTENEMNSSLEDFLFHPYPVEDIKRHFEIHEQKITGEDFGFQLYIKSARIPDNFNPDLNIG